MKKRKMTPEESAVYRKYHIPSCGNLTSIKEGAVFLRTGNTLAHEIKKTEICYELQKLGCKFITEAERARKRNEERKIVDIVDLSGNEIEIIHKHESDLDIQRYRAEGIIPIIVNSMFCRKCGVEYPERNKKNICQICKEEK